MGLPATRNLRKPQDMNADKKVAVITGASQGIGAGLVNGYLERGYRVVANSRRMAPGSNPDVQTVAGDIGDPETAERIVGLACDRFGRIDTLVNNAGRFLPKPFVDYTAAEFAAVVAVNLAGFFHITQRTAAVMLRQGSGHIVNITTAFVEQPMASLPAALAALTKGGLDAVTRSLAIEYAGTGIRVNAISPGVVKTPMHQPEAYEFLAGLQPLGRLAEVEEIVEAVLYLEAASFVTGETLHVDGGANAGRW